MISTYSPAEWEAFVHEWASEALGGVYAAVHMAPGAGDQGRDVIGYLEANPSTSPYDNYQCKHYRDPLAPGDLWKELGKLCWYTFQGQYAVPRRYYFAAPQGPGPGVLRLIEQPEAIRQQLIARWETHCATQITGGRRIELGGPLLAYVEAFDFGIVRALNPDEMIRQHAETRYGSVRFGGGLRRRRPDPDEPPDEVQPTEVRYVRHLLDAYGEALRAPLPALAALDGHPPRYRRHLARQREWFYRADSLRRFERDNLPDDSGFVALMDEVRRGVADVFDRDYGHGLERAEATLDAASRLPIRRYVLVECLESTDLVGICHHLANDDRLCWCVRDDS